MLINEIRDLSKDVPEKKIILDQMDPSDLAELVLQIAAYGAVDSIRGRFSEDQDVSIDDVKDWLDSLRAKMEKFTDYQIKKSINNAKAGKI